MKWISVNDSLPTKGISVFAYASFYFGGVHFVKELEIAYVDTKGDWTLSEIPEADCVVVTHWMPLPEPPEVNDEQADM